MISVGHRTGLFDAMRDSLPATSRDIAERTGLNARYVREWLGALLTAGVVEFEPVTKQFFLPPEHAGYLTPVAGADNIGVFAQYIVALGGVPHDVATPQNAGGSVPDTQVGFRVSTANEMQNERHRGQDKKNVNQSTGHVKNNPPTNPGNHQNDKRYYVAAHKTSRTAPKGH